MRGPNQAPSARASLLLPPYLSYFNGHKPCTWILHRGATSNKFRVLTDSNSNPKFNNTSDSYQLPHSSYLKDLMHHKITSNGSRPQVSENPALLRCPDTESSPHLVQKEGRSCVLFFKNFHLRDGSFFGNVQASEKLTSK